jgi:hypothetical protein
VDATERHARNLPNRIIDKIEFTDVAECWVWIGTGNNKGYGRVWFDGGMRLAHRVVYEILNGPIPKGMVIDHLCRVRRCVNPSHLEVVTTRENLLRGNTVTAMAAAKTHCPQGHEFTPENILPDRGTRRCRTCHTERCRAYYWRKKAEKGVRA